MGETGGKKEGKEEPETKTEKTHKAPQYETGKGEKGRRKTEKGKKRERKPEQQPGKTLNPPLRRNENKNTYPAQRNR